MTNTLGFYNPQFYANEGLIQLNKVLGMAGRVYKNYDQERRKYKLGDTINIRRPSVFTAQAAPSAAQNINTDSVSMLLNQWFDVRFSLTDQELAYTGDRIITDHINPAAIAIADNIDQALVALYKDIPWLYDATASTGTGGLTDIPNTRKVMFDNKAPVYDSENMFLMLGSSLEAGYLALPGFAQQQGAGDQGAQTQMRGALGPKYGFNIFSNQNVVAHTQGTYIPVGATTMTGGNLALGATSLTITAATSATGTLVKGDTFVIAGNAQRYAVTATATVVGAAITVSFAPPAVQAYSNNSVVTIINVSATNGIALTNTSSTTTGTNIQNLGFHRNAFGIAFAELSTIGNELGAKIATAVDPITGLAMRARMYYDGVNVNVVLDVLYGVKTLNANLGVRLRS